MYREFYVDLYVLCIKEYLSSHCTHKVHHYGAGYDIPFEVTCMIPWPGSVLFLIVFHWWFFFVLSVGIKILFLLLLFMGISPVWYFERAITPALFRQHVGGTVDLDIKTAV